MLIDFGGFHHTHQHTIPAFYPECVADSTGVDAISDEAFANLMNVEEDNGSPSSDDESTDEQAEAEREAAEKLAALKEKEELEKEVFRDEDGEPLTGMRLDMARAKAAKARKAANLAAGVFPKPNSKEERQKAAEAKRKKRAAKKFAKNLRKYEGKFEKVMVTIQVGPGLTEEREVLRPKHPRRKLLENDTRSVIIKRKRDILFEQQPEHLKHADHVAALKAALVQKNGAAENAGAAETLSDEDRNEDKKPKAKAIQNLSDKELGEIEYTPEAPLDIEANFEGPNWKPVVENAEQFVLTCHGLPQFELRVKTLNASLGFSEKLQAIDAQVTCLTIACNFILEDTVFQDVLTHVLHLGNVLNAGHKQRGQADGFQLAALTTLGQTKCTNFTLEAMSLEM